MIELLGGDQAWLDGLSGTELPEIQPETTGLGEATLPAADGNLELIDLSDASLQAQGEDTAGIGEPAAGSVLMTTAAQTDSPDVPATDVSFGGNANEGGIKDEIALRIAGWQEDNPHCLIHAVGNFAQCQNPVMGEEINRTIYRIAANHGWLHESSSGGYGLNIEGVKPILEQGFNIPCDWYRLDPEDLLPELEKGHMAMVGVRGKILDPSRYSSNTTLHAINLTGYKVVNGELFMRGLDSNIPGEEMLWPVETVRKAMAEAKNLVLLSKYPLAPVI